MDVERCKYNHILLGPEQAVAPRFRKILRDPDFAKSVGVVIVDGCHVLSTWERSESPLRISASSVLACRHRCRCMGAQRH